MTPTHADPPAAAGAPGADAAALTLERVFEAPLALVWKAWTEAEHIARWWGPEGFTTRVTENDLRVGGRTRFVMVGPDGTEYPVAGTVVEIVPETRIVTTDEFDEGFPASDGADLPTGMVMTAEFQALGAMQTRLTITMRHRNAADRRKHEDMGVVAGWQSSFDCLDRYLAELSA